MFEKETKFLYDFSMNQIKQLGSYITFDELSGANLHPAVTRYISAEIDYLINEDRQRLLTSSNFDYSGEEINKFFILITKEIKRTKKFSLDYIGNIILHAISFNINYISQPNWSVVKLIFAKDNLLKTNEVLQILKYVYYYDYIPELIETYIKKKNLLNIEKNEIEALLLKADKEIFVNTPSRLLERVLFTMGEFVNIGSFNKTKVPLLMFELYLKEKKLDEYWEKLESALGTDVKQVYEIPELQKMLLSPASQAKKESYLDKIIHQDKPLGIFRRESKRELQEEEPLLEKESVPEEEPLLEEEPFIEDEPTEENSLQGKDTPVLEDEHLNSDDNNTIPVIKENPLPEKDLLPAEEPLSGEESLLEEFTKPGNPDTDSETKDEQSFLPESEQAAEEIEFEIKTEEDFIFLEDEADEQLAELGEALKDFKTLESSEKLNENDNLLEKELKETFELKEPETMDVNTVLNENEELKEVISINENIELTDIPELNNGPEMNDIPVIKDDMPVLSVDIQSENGIQSELDEFFSDKKSEDETDFAGDMTVIDIKEKMPEESGAESVDAVSGDLSDEAIMLRYLEESELDNQSAVKTAGRKKELSDYFSQREMHKVVTTVFNENLRSLAQAFEELEKCRSLAEAEGVLNSVFISNMVSPSSKGAKIIKKNLSKYFNQV